jgi:hypothetical protein
MTKYTNAGAKGNNPGGQPGEDKKISLPKSKQRTKPGIVTGKGGPPNKTDKPSG